MTFEEIFKDKTILITGGTGFLGRALTKEILTYEPQSIRLLSRDEVKHHKMQEQFQYHPKLRMLIGDIRDSLNPEWQKTHPSFQGQKILLMAICRL